MPLLSCDLVVTDEQKFPDKVRINDPKASPAHFSTGIIGGDNSIARHGIHGL